VFLFYRANDPHAPNPLVPPRHTHQVEAVQVGQGSEAIANRPPHPPPPPRPLRRGSCNRGTDLQGGGRAGGREEREGKGGREERVFVRSHISLAKIFYMWDQDGESSCPEVFFMCDVS